MKKYTFLFLLILISASSLTSPAQAARAVPGSAPNTAPLQPIPQTDLAPNLQNNIQSQTQTEPATIQPSAQLQQTGNTAGEQNALPATTAQTAKNQTSPTTDLIWIWAILTIAIFGLAVWTYWKSKQK